MTQLLASERFDHFNLPELIRLSDANKMYVALEAEREELLRILKGLQRSILEQGAVLVPVMIDYRIYKGLEKIINSGEINDEAIESQFFTHFFIWCFERSDAETKKKLILRLKSSLSSDQGIQPFFAELEVGFGYLQQGCDVNFIDLVSTNASSHDLVVSRNGISLNVEVKSVNYETILPIKAEALSKTASTFSQWVKNYRNKNEPLYFELTLKNNARPSYRELQSSLANLLDGAKQTVGNWENHLLKLAIGDATPELILASQPEQIIESQYNMIPGTPFDFTIPQGPETENTIVKLRFEDNVYSSNAITKAIDRAARQLKKEQLAVIHICLHKTGFINPKIIERQAMWLACRDDHISKLFKKNSWYDIAGVQISCDSFYTETAGTEKIRSSHPYLSFLGNPSCLQMIFYAYNFTPNMTSGRDT